MQQPTPFTLVEAQAGKLRMASNAAVRIMCLDDDGTVFLRRGLSGVMAAPSAQNILPQLNALAGEVLANSAMAPADIAARLHALQLSCKPVEAKQIEWACVRLGDVRVFTDGEDIIVTRQNIEV